MKALYKFAKSPVEEYLANYKKIEFTLITGEKMTLSRKEVRSRVKELQRFIDRGVIVKAYKIHQGDRREKLELD